MKENTDESLSFAFVCSEFSISLNFTLEKCLHVK